MYMVVLWCERRNRGRTPPFSPMFQRICMQMCPLPIIREGKASKHAQGKLLIFYPFYLVFTWFLLEKHFGPLLRSYIHDIETDTKFVQDEVRKVRSRELAEFASMSHKSLLHIGCWGKRS